MKRHLVFLLLVIGIGRLVAPHRIFPAARIERYTTCTDSSVDLIVNGRQFDILHAPFTPEVDVFLEAASERYLKAFFPKRFEPQESGSPPTNHSITLQRLVLSVATNNTDLRHNIDESYSLYIRKDTATLTATTVHGILHGLETFSQLLEKEQNGWIIIRQTPIVIMDAPEYPYRGLMIDTARHYLPLSLILENLDAMAMNKLNVLHWHVTDSQSFPYLSTAYPEIADRGAFAPSLIYTPHDIALVIAQAKLRGIRVIPEFDMPGHTGAIGASHPEFMSHCPGPSEPLDPTSPAVYRFLQRFHQEIAQLFPDEMIHVGGDEVSLDCWKNSSSIQLWMKEHGMDNETQLLDYFQTKLMDIIVGRTKIVWQEVFNLGLTLPKDTIIDVWKGYDNVTIQEATLAGYQVIVSGCWYLDHLGDDWNDFHECIPRNFTGTAQQKSLVLGGHASMWGERVDSTNFMQRVWPRASAAAERLWNSNKTAEDTFQTRLFTFRCHMVARGIPASPVLPGFCNDELKSTITQKQFSVK